MCFEATRHVTRYMALLPKHDKDASYYTDITDM